MSTIITNNTVVWFYRTYVLARFYTAYGLYANKNTKAIKTTKNRRPPVVLNTHRPIDKRILILTVLTIS